MNGNTARNELRCARREGDRRADAGSEIETCCAAGRVLRQVTAQPRVEDLDIEGLQAKSRLAPRQQLRDVRDQLPSEHDLRRERQLVQAVLVEERERVGVLAEGLVREVRGEERDSFFLALRLRVRLEVFGLAPNPDILGEVAALPKGPFCVGFAAKRPLRE